jgi:putative toxin-antitoxin system antitoxin component (TIGR02293 family)
MATKFERIVFNVQEELKRNEPLDALAWAVLDCGRYTTTHPISGIDMLEASRRGIPKGCVVSLAAVLDVPMTAMAALLNMSYKTLGRKKETDILDSLSSSLSIEIANTVAKGLYVFEDKDKFNRWLHKQNRALGGQKPFDLLNTPTGIKLVNQVLGRIDEGVYS